MKILAVADEEPLILWDYFDPELVKGVDLIISCGDLKASFLDFLMTMTNAPLLYVHGNHDEAYVKDPPPGAVCIEDMLYNFNGLRILGLGGSMKYRNGTFMHTERQMAWRVWKASWKARLHGGFDILVTHAPCQGYGDMEDLPHRGFETFVKLLDRCNNVSTMAGSFPRGRMVEYIEETEQYILPLASVLKNEYPEYSDLAFLSKYQILSVLETIKYLITE